MLLEIPEDIANSYYGKNYLQQYRQDAEKAILQAKKTALIYELRKINSLYDVDRHKVPIYLDKRIKELQEKTT